MTRDDLYVICRSLREYNAYRNFLESEFMKLYKAKEDAVKERERRVRIIIITSPVIDSVIA